MAFGHMFAISRSLYIALPVILIFIILVVIRVIVLAITLEDAILANILLEEQQRMLMLVAIIPTRALLTEPASC